jgi:hypothetical protein
VAKCAGLVAVHRELFVIQHGLAKQLDLLDLVGWRHSQSAERLRLNAINLGFDLRDFLQYFGREQSAGRFVGACIDSRRSNDGERSEQRGRR